jgi:hypothetical protein
MYRVRTNAPSGFREKAGLPTDTKLIRGAYDDQGMPTKSFAAKGGGLHSTRVGKRVHQTGLDRVREGDAVRKKGHTVVLHNPHAGVTSGGNARTYAVGTDRKGLKTGDVNVDPGQIIFRWIGGRVVPIRVRG